MTENNLTETTIAASPIVEEKRALLSFAIGPVQEYITAARRTQDLYVGSRLLSLLVRQACEKIGWEEHVIYPARPDNLRDDTPLPNRLVASFHTTDAALEAAREAEKVVRQHWRDMGKEVKRWIQDKLDDYRINSEGWEETWDSQIENYLEVYWAVLPIEKGEAGFKARWNLVQEALASRKNLRAFGLNPQPGYKCTIFGWLSAMGPGQSLQGQSYGAMRAFWRELADQLNADTDRGVYISLRPDGRERLSAIACMKRFAGKVSGELRRGVPSTSSIAAGNFRASLLERIPHDGRLRELLGEFRSALNAIKDKNARGIRAMSVPEYEHRTHDPKWVTPHLLRFAQKVSQQYSELVYFILAYDGDIFYRETLRAQRLRDDYGLKVCEGADNTEGGKLQDVSNQLFKARSALSDLLDYLSRSEVEIAGEKLQPIQPPSNYYAVLAMDGDNMSKTLRALEEAGEYEKFSKVLAKFASQVVPAIIEGSPGGYSGPGTYIGTAGRLIYAGGDDVLALVPAADALRVARELQQAFTALRSEIGLEKVKRLTASVGIATAHHMSQLDIALNEARNAEHAAKEDYGRNAVGLHILKRAGAPLRVGLHNADNGFDRLELIEKLVNDLSSDRTSHRAAYLFARDAQALSDHYPRAMLAAVLRQIASQRQKRENLLDLVPNLLTLAASLSDASLLSVRQGKGEDLGAGDSASISGKAVNPSQKTTSAAKRLADWLLAASFIARGGVD